MSASDQFDGSANESAKSSKFPIFVSPSRAKEKLAVVGGKLKAGASQQRV